MTQWVISAIPKQASIRLFCFHHAGGGASFFRSWIKLFEDNIAICPVQLPGREDRFRESRIICFNDLIEELFVQLKPYLQEPYAFFGHSLGGLIAYALTQKAYTSKLPLPLTLFVSAHRAPHISHSYPCFSTMSFNELKTFIRYYEGMPESILQNEEWMKFLIPIIRDDFLLCQSYEYCLQDPVPCSIYTFGGNLDRMVSKFEILAWRQHTMKQFQSYFYPDGHFFLKTQQTQLINIVKTAIETSFLDSPKFQ